MLGGPPAAHPNAAPQSCPSRCAGCPLPHCIAPRCPVLSSRETRSSLHYDPYQNLLCVVRGRKRVWLLPPSCTPHLSRQPLTHESANHSPADLARPDAERFPGLPAALGRLQEFELAAGGALFIPNGWWHQVGGVGMEARPGGLADRQAD